jgi:quercetin dioxygenase-like cupin family protein
MKMKLFSNKKVITLNKMVDTELQPSKAHITVEIIEYVPNTPGIKTILKKSTGKFSVTSINSGGMLTERSNFLDTFVQIIEGKAEIVINGRTNSVKTGQSLVIPALIPHFVKPDGSFKMILTVIKND